MRIATPSCGLAPESTSGGECYERELLTRWTGAQHEILLARGKPCAAPPHWRVTRLPIRRGLRWWVAPAVVPWALRRLYARRPFDVLRVHSLRFMGPAALLARLPVPVVAHHHHLDDWRRIERAVVARVDAVIVGSAFARDQLAAAGFRTDHVTVVPYGVDATRFAPAPRQDSRPTVLFVGGLKPRKRLELLITRIWPLVRERVRDARLVIAGTGPLWAALQALHDPSLALLGYVPEAAKPRVYQQADAFVFPSALEGFGLAVAEAMAAGLPVVASARGSLPELVGDAGLLCETAGDMVDSLVALLRDAALRREIGARARERVLKAFTWERCVQDTAAVYESL